VWVNCLVLLTDSVRVNINSCVWVNCLVLLTVSVWVNCSVLLTVSVRVTVNVGELFSVKVNVNSQTHQPHVDNQPQCITCDISEDCQYVDAQFSTTGDYYIEQCLGPAVPTYTLKKINPGGDIEVGKSLV